MFNVDDFQDPPTDTIVGILEDDLEQIKKLEEDGNCDEKKE